MKTVMNRLKAGTTGQKRRSGSASGGWLGRYWAEDRGSMSYLAVAGALVMMVFGGIGIDMIHAELKRNKVQNTLDRAVLAAANVNNELDPTLTVESYFSAMGMSDALQGVTVNQAPGSRMVSADGLITMPSNLMSLIGVDTLQAAGSATAVNGMAKIEVSLVLDISGSMSGTKITQLKTAAKSFIDTLIPPGTEDPLVTISIVPYNATVNPGTALAQHFDIQRVQPFSNCVTFSSADYAETEIDTSQDLRQIGHFDPYDGGTEASNPWCATGAKAAIVPHSSDPVLLKAAIDQFTAGGNTAINLGVKWGAALLDPAMRPVMEAMAGDGDMVAPITPRPAEYDDNEAMKFIVVMTDGANTSQFDLKAARKSGLSNAWVDDRGTASTSDDRISIKVRDLAGETNDVYLWTHLIQSNPSGAFKNTPFSWQINGAVANASAVVSSGDLNPAITSTGSAAWNATGAGSVFNFTRGGGPRRLSNTELNARIKTSAYGNTYYWFAYQKGYVTYQQYVDTYYAWEEIVGADQADSELATICSAAKSQGVVVYGIGVEAPARGLTAMSGCSSSPAHYYDVQGSDLNETFASIARSLQTLRLIQ